MGKRKSEQANGEEQIGKRKSERANGEEQMGKSKWGRANGEEQNKEKVYEDSLFENFSFWSKSYWREDLIYLKIFFFHSLKRWLLNRISRNLLNFNQVL